MKFFTMVIIVLSFFGTGAYAGDSRPLDSNKINEELFFQGASLFWSANTVLVGGILSRTGGPSQPIAIFLLAKGVCDMLVHGDRMITTLFTGRNRKFKSCAGWLEYQRIKNKSLSNRDEEAALESAELLGAGIEMLAGIGVFAGAYKNRAAFEAIAQALGGAFVAGKQGFPVGSALSMLKLHDETSLVSAPSGQNTRTAAGVGISTQQRDSAR